MILKIGRYEYEITSSDVFIDNGACIQLLSQKKFKHWYYITPVLSKKAIEQINKFERIPREHKYTSNVEVFSLKL